MFSKHSDEIGKVFDDHESDTAHKEAGGCAHSVSFNMRGTYFNIKIVVTDKPGAPSTNPA